MTAHWADRPLLRAAMMACGLLLATNAGAAPRLARPRPQHLALPDARRLAAGEWADIDAIAGEAPTPAHPRGTVLVAQTTALEPSPTVTEWDLATAALVRSAAVPLPATQADLRIVRAGNAIHLLAARPPAGPIVYARLRASLEAERVESLGFGERPRVTSDGSVIAILWSGTRKGAPGERGWQLVILDARGNRLWSTCLLRTNGSTFLYGNPLALVSGHVFVLLPDGARPSIVEFAADGRVQHVRALPGSPDDGRVFESAGRLLFTDDCTLATLWSFDGAAAPRVRLPHRPEQSRSCAAFDAVADPGGRLVTSQGDVFSAAVTFEQHFADPGDAVAVRPLWIFGAPALLVVEPTRGHAWLDWGDTAAPAARGASVHRLPTGGESAFDAMGQRP